MAPSSPHDVRTYHLLRTPDILLANDSRPTGSYISVNIANQRFSAKNAAIAWKIRKLLSVNPNSCLCTFVASMDVERGKALRGSGNDLAVSPLKLLFSSRIS
jgi:hypothetical protein